MATAAMNDITTLLQARSKWRGSVTLPSIILEKVETIRGDVHSGEDAQGWNKVSSWRSGPVEVVEVAVAVAAVVGALVAGLQPQQAQVVAAVAPPVPALCAQRLLHLRCLLLHPLIVVMSVSSVTLRRVSRIWW